MLKKIKLFKYLPFTEGSLKVLTEGTMKFTKPSEFNDPFDCAPDHESHNIKEFVSSRPDLIEKVVQFNRVSPDKIESEKLLMIKRLKTAINNGEFGQKASDSVGICSLTRDPLNLLMWAHYSKDHTGFVVEFNIPLESFYPINNDIKYFEWLIPQKVEYQETKPVVNFSDDQNTKIKKQFLIKGDVWSYEQEERVIDYIRGSGIHKFDQNAILSSVIVGMKMESPEYMRIKKILAKLFEKNKLKVALHKVDSVKGKFELFVSDRPDLLPSYNKTMKEKSCIKKNH